MVFFQNTYIFFALSHGQKFNFYSTNRPINQCLQKWLNITWNIKACPLYNIFDCRYSCRCASNDTNYDQEPAIDPFKHRNISESKKKLSYIRCLKDQQVFIFNQSKLASKYSTNKVKDEIFFFNRQQPFQTKVDVWPAVHFTSSIHQTYIVLYYNALLTTTNQRFSILGNTALTQPNSYTYINISSVVEF